MRFSCVISGFLFTILRILIHLLYIESGDSFRVDDKEIGSASLVGIVRKVDNKPTKMVYTIDDYTGMAAVSN